MINEFLKTYKDGGMVYLDPTERDRIVEEINRLKRIDESHQRLNGELREENKRLYEELEAKRHDKYITDLITENGVICMKNKEIERLHSIIKEVREYIKENQEEHKYIDRGGFTYTEGHFLRDSDTLLEILDRGNE